MMRAMASLSLSQIRADLGASGVADAIRRALAAHPTVTAAAEALGTTPRALRRAAQRAGVAWPESPRAPGAAGGARAARARKGERAETPSGKAVSRNRTKGVDTGTDRT